MTDNKNPIVNTRQIADSKSLSGLASQLYSEGDRQHYANVIYLAENLKRQIQLLQFGCLAQPISIMAPLRVNTSPQVVGYTYMPGQNFENPQDPDRYVRRLERSQSIRKTVSRFSSDFDDDTEILSSAPLHPPPSFPPPPTPGIPLPSQSLSDIKMLKILPRLPITETSPSTPKKHADEPITPPASPNRPAMQVRIEYNDPPLPPLPSPPPKPPLIRIVHVRKRINGFRGFLTRTYQLSNDIVMSRAHTTHLRLFTATQIMTGEPKAILKLVLTGFRANGTDTADLKIKHNGFSFYWPGGPAQPRIKTNRASDVTQFASVPDSRVQEVLEQWIRRQAVLPPLHQATHILRESVKIYVVYNRILFSHLYPTM